MTTSRDKQDPTTMPENTTEDPYGRTIGAAELYAEFAATLAAQAKESSMSLDTLATALFARGEHQRQASDDATAQRARGMLPGDATLRMVGDDELFAAALEPGVETLDQQWSTLAPRLGDADPLAAREAEEGLAELIDEVERCDSRILGLDALERDALAARARAELNEFERTILATAELDELLGWAERRLAEREEAEAAETVETTESTRGGGSLWARVAQKGRELQRAISLDVLDNAADDPIADLLAAAPRFFDEELLAVIEGEADTALEQQVTAALERDDALRSSYDGLLADLETWHASPAPPAGVIDLQALHLARKMIACAAAKESNATTVSLTPAEGSIPRVPISSARWPQAQPDAAPQRLAAADAAPIYSSPSDNAHVHTFADGSTLYAETDDSSGRWLLRLYGKTAINEELQLNGCDEIYRDATARMVQAHALPETIVEVSSGTEQIELPLPALSEMR